MKEDSYIVPEGALLIIFDSRSGVCMDGNGKGAKHIKPIAIRLNFLRNGEKCKINNIDWCEGGM